MPTPPNTPTDGPAWFEFGRAALVAAAAKHHADAVADDDVADIQPHRAALHASLDGDESFAVLAANAQLPLADTEVFALLATAEIDVHCRRLVGTLPGGWSRLTLGTLAEVLGPAHRAPLAVANGAALRRSAFVEVGDDGPWADHPIALHASVVWSLLGDHSADPSLPVGIETYDAPIDTSIPDGQVPGDLVVVTGPDAMRRRQVGARHSVAERFLVVDAPGTDTEWAALVREATITGRAVIVQRTDATDALLLRRWLERAEHLVWVISSASAPPIESLPSQRWVEVAAGDEAPTDAEWSAVLGDGVARTHRLTFDQLHRIQRTRDAVGGDVDAAVRRLASGPLEQLTRRITPTRTWDDIVLSPDRLALLQTISDRYRHATTIYDSWGFSPNPSRGLVALFAGPSGTGKTLAAEIIAGSLGLDVFKLDLSAVVSKYIGETEKNLEQVFDAASAGNMVLFFDEADSLFGKRSEVRDARDRYANLEVSYLLQRLEAYDGLVILATNYEKNVDDAFLRRIHVRVEFAPPGVDERRAIWAGNFPTDAPLDGVDVDWLAERFELTGGAIRNAAVHAAFTAAAAGTPITMERAVTGVARELRKMGRLLKDKDFGEYASLVNP